MYLEFYGLKEAPFSITPDPRYVFLSERHRDALAHLLYGIGKGGSGGFVQLTGEVGTGKTTICRLLLEQLPENTRVALVLNPKLSPIELLETIGEELKLDISAVKGSLKGLVDTLNTYLLDAYAQGLRVVLIIDEAQNLSAEALEQVRLLTNLETPTQKLLQIILLGQPELRDELNKPELRQLAQRITARYHLTPLDRDEAEAYVRHRLAVAGSRAHAVFAARTARAVSALERRSARDQRDRRPRTDGRLRARAGHDRRTSGRSRRRRNDARQHALLAAPLRPLGRGRADRHGASPPACSFGGIGPRRRRSSKRMPRWRAAGRSAHAIAQQHRAQSAHRCRSGRLDATPGALAGQFLADRGARRGEMPAGAGGRARLPARFRQ